MMRQLLSSGNWSLFLQLHPLCAAVLLLLWLLMMLPMVEEGFSDVGLDIFAVLGVKANDVSFSISFRGCGSVFLAVVKAFVEST